MRFMILLMIFALMFNLGAEIKVLFEEYFDDNINGWTIGDNENRNLYLSDGKYIFTYKHSDNEWITWNSADIDHKQNFSIKTTITHVNGVDDRGFGIVWGLNDVSNYLCFDLSDNGYYRFSKVDNDNWVDLIPWTEDYLYINTDEANLIEIRKNEEKYEFYLNNYYLASYDYQEFFGDKIGYHIFHNQTIAVDDLVITQLPVYKNIRESDMIYFNNFSEKGEWLEKEDTDISLEIRDGKYVLDHKTAEGGWFSWLSESDLDENEDFSIQAEILKLSGDDWNEYGITWGLRDINNYFKFSFTTDGFYSISKVENGEYYPFIDFAMNPAIRSSASPNLIEIRKSGDFYEFYVNKSFVAYTDYQQFPGNNFGFFVYGLSVIGVDFVSIEKLPQDFDYRKIDLARLPLGKNFSEPVLIEGSAFIELSQPVENFNLTENGKLFKLLTLGFMGTANIAERYQALRVKVTDNSGLTREFTVLNNIFQDFNNKLISKEEFIDKISVE
ncbi:MAG: hypothetical protein JW996_06910 [Candidatus Cloacimonetes bacterium]|nr:hypothetical protein [Candidatus Cloacimonadota bacterium]